MITSTDKTYVQERQSEYWTSRQVEDFFENFGADVQTFPVPQNIEKVIPADFIFLPGQKIKIFGFQYKALYQAKTGDYWKLTQHQHGTLQNFSWIYYGLSELKSRRNKRNCLHLLKIYEPVRISFPAQGKFLASGSTTGYYRWGGFFKRLQECQCGLRVRSLVDLKQALGTSFQQIFGDLHLYIHNFDSGMTVSINRLMAPDDT